MSSDSAHDAKMRAVRLSGGREGGGKTAVPLARAAAHAASTPGLQGGPKDLYDLLAQGPDFPHRAKILARLKKAQIGHLRDRAALEYLSEQADSLEALRPLLVPAMAGDAPSSEQERALDAIGQAKTAIRLRQQGILDRRATEAAQDVSAIIVKGETYALRRELRALAGKWNPELGGWIVPANKQAQAEALGAKLTVEAVDVKGSALQDLDRDEYDSPEAKFNRELDERARRIISEQIPGRSTRHDDSQTDYNQSNFLVTVREPSAAIGEGVIGR